MFVLHEHHRPRHHFDLRLEENGVLRSWAVPKGMPTDPGHNRLAVPVDDHELDHATYEDATKQIADIVTTKFAPPHVAVAIDALLACSPNMTALYGACMEVLRQMFA